VTKFTLLLAGGLSEGAIAALAAVGFLLTYKATGVVNFAQGALITLGAYLAIWATQGHGMFGWGVLAPIPAYIVAIAIMFVVGMIIERLAYAPLRGRSVHVIVIATLGASVVVTALIGLWQGTTPRFLQSPATGHVVTIFGAGIEEPRLVVIGVTAIIVIAILLLFDYTQFGRQLRATAADRDTARLCGVPVNMLSMLAFGMSAALAGVAGVLIGPTQAIDVNFGFQTMLLGFAAAVLGGFGSIGGVVAGGVAIGLAEQLLGGYIMPDYKGTFPFVLMLIIIAARPQGLFGRPSAARRL
jgi:branched-chain amino acid transport system permease protein